MAIIHPPGLPAPCISPSAPRTHAARSQMAMLLDDSASGA